MNKVFIILVIVFIINTLIIYTQTNNNDKILGVYNINSIDYNNPEKYLIPGNQSRIKEEYKKEIEKYTGKIKKQNMFYLTKLFKWYSKNFNFVGSGGKMIGKVDVNFLIEKKELYGCHSAALLISSLLREFGFPSIMVDTASVKWALDYKNNKRIGMIGHVLTEVYVNGKWILLDMNGSYIDNYNPKNPFITTNKDDPNQPAPLGLFVIRKGVDIWSYGVTEPDHVGKIMKDFANKIDSVQEYIKETGYKWKFLDL